MNRQELETKVHACKSAEEIEKVIAESGEKIEKDEANKIFDTLQEMRKEGKLELSTEELEAVSGGESCGESWAEWRGVDDCDYMHKREEARFHCASTVNKDETCWIQDACSYVTVVYV